ncbi:MAG TPA: hypothetical protein VN029_02645 [Sphingomonas sp.]|nr:hypothetical protein [Sphingomonas sp.]
MHSRSALGGVLAALILVVAPLSAFGQEKPAKARPGNQCLFGYEVTGPDGKLYSIADARLSGIGGRQIELSLHFDGALPDPAMASGSNAASTVQLGSSFVSARQADPRDYRMEKKGDSKPTYMREAPLAKTGETWFVGDRIDVLSRDATVSLLVEADFIDLLVRSRMFEIWWKGTRRLTVKIVPKQLPPEEFATACLALPASFREEMTRNPSSSVLRKLRPGGTPVLMDFIGNRTSRALTFNPFDTDDDSAGSATFQVTVGRDGLVKQCDLVAQRGKLRGRASACDRLRYHIRFFPATDAKGVPVEAETQYTVEWSAKP